MELIFVSERGSLVIDMTVSTPNLGRLVKCWHWSDEVSLSDHRYIRCTLEQVEVAPTYHRNPRNTNWMRYKEDLWKRMKDFPSRLGCKLELDRAAVNVE